VHAAGALVFSAFPCHALIELDAFHTVHRDSIFETIVSKVPKLLP